LSSAHFIPHGDEGVSFSNQRLRQHSTGAFRVRARSEHRRQHQADGRG
jgi:hypothetical protein